MNKWKKAEKLSKLIVKFGKGTVDSDTADLIAYRYFAKKSQNRKHWRRILWHLF